MKKRIFSLVVTLFLMGANTTNAAEPPPPENLANLIDSALANNPEIKASNARWQMFRSRIGQSAALEDPMLMLKIQNGLIKDPFSFDKDPMTQKVIGISQQVPSWGKRALKGEVATYEAEAYRWQAEERKLELRRMVAETYYQIYFTDKSLEIVAKNVGILDDFITLAETRYSVGQGAQQDIFKAQVERSKMLDMRITLEQQRKSLQAALNALLFRPADTPVGAIPDFDMQPLALSSDDLRALALQHRPLLKSLNAQIEKGKAGHRLAGKEFYPDFNLSFEYMQRDATAMDSGADMYSVGVTFNLPVQWARRQAMAAESSAEIAMANEELSSLKNSIGSSISDLAAQLERRQRLVELYKTGIIPQAEQSLESATIGYRVNKVDFLTMLDSRMTLFTYERELYDSLADYKMKLAQLEATVGAELAAVPRDQAPSASGGVARPKTAPAQDHEQDRQDRNTLE